MTVRPTWEDRDFPVLQAIVEHVEASGDDSFRPADLHAYLPAFFDATDIQRSLNALIHHQPPVLAGNVRRLADGSIFHVQGTVTGHARELVGLWPMPGELQDRLIARLDQAEADAADEDSKQKLRRMTEAVKDLGGETLKKIVTGWIGFS